MSFQLSSVERKRFESRIKRGKSNECWPWTGPTDGCGYGKLWADGRYIGAHRVALMLKLGRELEPGEQALHRCDNPPCCNPACLFAGTQAENIEDRRRKGRNGPRLRSGAAWDTAHANDPRKGADNGNAKLCEAVVANVRRRFAAGEDRAAIARSLKVTWPTIDRIVKGRGWKTR